jgi:hypothetical protein
MSVVDFRSRRVVHCRVAAMRSAAVTRRGLSDGQVVTLTVGLGLDLVPLHTQGRPFGPIHPAHVRMDETGRPHLRLVITPADWRPHDDWAALLRLGRVMGCSERSSELSIDTAGRREGVDLLRWLVQWAKPEPLPML